jgi:hypothetical protein
MLSQVCVHLIFYFFLSSCWYVSEV